MKKTKLALALTTAAFASSAMATNGTNMIGIGAQSNAMGGTGVAAFFGAENLLANPALIGKSEGTELIFGGTIFSPDVQTENNATTDGSAVSDTSDANLFVVPSAAFTSRINENMVYGIGMFGTSGMGVDYQDNPDIMRAQSALQVLRFIPTLAFHDHNSGIGFSPIIQYGALDIHYNTEGTQYGSLPGDKSNGHGMAQGLGFGYAVGAYYDVSKALTLAASYTSSIEMEYKGQLSSASEPFTPLIGEAFKDDLEQPAEIKLGAAYNFGNMTFTADAREIMWADAKGYGDFGWENQKVFSLGAKYSGKEYWVAAGYNHADNPIKEQDGTTGRGAVINFFNNTFFPATTESHLSLGGGMAISKKATVEGAFVYAPEVTNRVDISGMGSGAPIPAPSLNGDYSETKHSQMGATMMIRYNFDE
ncbi:outer membrane protein transport protein [Thiomicrorhabdus sp. 6S2-11]|uniref:Outer membrane protein transport protein n=1 Tax=Thiomicrorhabdus marina TaxID=2818442 RepID=A0ABS3Q3X4_9GAMM|nr:outer membrane protein transport protein [Thiomicrorhabdus marina]MBO1927019.1 outer membrane protein transport protein [Thiomicrorhabdus marina]